MESSEFDVVLSSDMDKDLYPDNNPGYFRNKLCRRLILPGIWTVTLLDISLPKSWVTSVNIALQLFNSTTMTDLTESKNIEILSNDGLADVTRKLTEGAIHNSLSKQITFEVYQKDRIAIIPGILKATDGTDIEIIPKFDNFASEVLGMSTNYTYKKGKIIADRPFHLFDNDLFYIETDIIEPIPVGSSEKSLLRFLTSKAYEDYGDNVYYTFDKPQKRRLKSSYIESILIDIKTIKEKNPSFRFGTSLVTLRFRHDTYF